jgi:transcriptional regulator with XRE-family HTH domain
MAKESKNQKNPLNQAFGMALRSKREEHSLTWTDVEKRSGLKASYIQQVEKGQFNLHVSNCLALYNTFRIDVVKDYFTLEGLMQLLSIISVLEVKGNEHDNYMKGVGDAARELSRHSKKIEILFEKFFEFHVFESKSSEEAADLISTNNIDGTVSSYLIDYYDFERSYELRHKLVLGKFFDDVPSIYFEFLQNLKVNLLRLPAQIAFAELWQWEDRNTNNFKSLTLIMESPDAIVSEKNLSQYLYKYLWAKQFESVRFMFRDTHKKASEIIKEFETNLEKGIRKSNEKGLADRFEEGVRKVHVRVLPNGKPTRNKIQHLLANPKAGSNQYTSLWIFTLQDDYCVSFLADINRETLMVDAGLSLNMEETLRRNSLLDELWESVPDENKIPKAAQKKTKKDR